MPVDAKTTAGTLENFLITQGDASIAEHSHRFFKTGAGEYGEGDKFLGIRVPTLRSLVKEHRDQLTLGQITELLHSEWHEVRLCALFLMVSHYQRGTEKDKKATVSAYLKNKKYINNWDLVDSSAYQIIGAWHHDKDRTTVDKLINAKQLWSRRIAMMSTFYHIRQNDLDDTYRYAEILLADKEDLMHKVTGWMLREAGKRDTARLESYIQNHVSQMPRTMLRYAIEKLPAKKRKQILSL